MNGISLIAGHNSDLFALRIVAFVPRVVLCNSLLAVCVPYHTVYNFPELGQS